MTLVHVINEMMDLLRFPDNTEDTKKMLLTFKRFIVEV